MMRSLWPWVLIGLGAVAVGTLWFLQANRRSGFDQPVSPGPEIRPATLAGSQSCRECHPRFFDLWSTSHHGLAMQPFTPDLARTFTAPPREIASGTDVYRAEITAEGGFVHERGEAGERRYPIAHVMGGKNIYYLLTPLHGGRLQTLPVAYDVRRNEWFDTAASAMRHFQEVEDAPVAWRDPLYTFNTSCHACHVSQLSTNYDPTSDTYHTTWLEPGINCETCHGPSAEHVRVCREAPPGQTPADLKIIRTSTFTPQQHNDSCSSCHAKASILTDAFQPQESFFDHFDLATLENPDFYPDGRDLGENYTYTTWRMSACAQAGELHCVHCHTSSGRYRFHGEKANDACLPCHAQRVGDPVPHTHHPADSTGSQCVNCHMPTTEFARMRRSDHSMRPPMPAATLAHKSPNACNLCHADKDAAWADGHVRQWHAPDYQAPVLHRAELIAAARRSDWSRLPEMLTEITAAQRDEIFATSFIRLLANCARPDKWPTLLEALKDASPLVRSAAATGLAGWGEPRARQALLAATADSCRLVRIRAAGALAGYPDTELNASERVRLVAATAELEKSLQVRLDDWASHHSLGNHYMDTGRLQEAVACFQTASKLRPDIVHPHVNAAIAHARLGNNEQSRQCLERALAIDPDNAAAHFNMGLLQAELGRSELAVDHLRRALTADPRMGQAAYNLGLLLIASHPQEGLELLRKAHTLQPEDARFGYTLGFYLYTTGDVNQATALLESVVGQHSQYVDALTLLGSIYEQQARHEEARNVYRQALGVPSLSPSDRQAIESLLQAVPQP